MKKLTYFLSCLFLFINYCIIAQPNIEWAQNYGGSEDEDFHSVQQTLDGGYIAAGFTISDDRDISVNKGERDFWVVKLDPLGEIEWEQTYGGSKIDLIRSIQQTLDGGYIVAGSSESSDGDVGGNYGLADGWILKIDQNGEIEWEKNYGSIGYDYITNIQETADGSFIVVGAIADIEVDIYIQDIWIFKINELGEIEWEKQYGGSENEGVNSIQLTVDGGYIIAGYSASNDGDVEDNKGKADYWILKLDQNGELEWQKCYGGSEGDFPAEIQQTVDGGYIIAGASYSKDGDVEGANEGIFEDSWILKLDQNGELEWQKVYGGSFYDYTSSVQQTPDNGYILAGVTRSTDGDISTNYGYSDAWILKLDVDGDMEWEKSFGGSFFDWANTIQATTDGGFIVVGNSASDDGDVGGNYGKADCWVFKLAPLSVAVNELEWSPFFKITPNPAKESFNIQLDDYNQTYHLTIFNAVGIPLFEKNDAIGVLTIDELTKGIYYVSITSETKMYTQKLIIH